MQMAFKVTKTELFQNSFQGEDLQKCSLCRQEKQNFCPAVLECAPLSSLFDVRLHTSLCCLHALVDEAKILFVEEQGWESALCTSLLYSTCGLPGPRHQHRHQFWMKPSQTSSLWDNFENKMVLPEGWWCNAEKYFTISPHIGLTPSSKHHCCFAYQTQ